MDRKMLERHLAMSEKHIALGERIIAKQVEIIRVLEHGGHDSSQAKSLLEAFKELQTLHILEREYTLREIAELEKLA